MTEDLSKKEWLTTSEATRHCRRSRRALGKARASGTVPWKMARVLVICHDCRCPRPIHRQRMGFLYHREELEAWNATAPRAVKRRRRAPKLPPYPRSQEAVDMMKADGIKLPFAAQRVKLKPRSVERYLLRKLNAGKITQDEYNRLRQPEK